MNNYTPPDYGIPNQMPVVPMENEKKVWNLRPLLVLTVVYLAVMVISHFFAPWESIDISAAVEINPKIAELRDPDTFSLVGQIGNPVLFGIWFTFYGILDFAIMFLYLNIGFYSEMSLVNYAMVIFAMLLPSLTLKIVNSYAECKWNRYTKIQKFLSSFMLQNILFYFLSIFLYYIVPWSVNLLYGFTKNAFSDVGDEPTLLQLALFILFMIGLLVVFFSFLFGHFSLMSVLIVINVEMELFKYVYAAVPIPNAIAYPLFTILGIVLAFLVEAISDFWFTLERRLASSCCLGGLLSANWIDALVKNIFAR